MVPHSIELLAWVALALGFASALVVAGDIVVLGNRHGNPEPGVTDA